MYATVEGTSQKFATQLKEYLENVTRGITLTPIILESFDPEVHMLKRLASSKNPVGVFVALLQHRRTRTSSWRVDNFSVDE